MIRAAIMLRSGINIKPGIKKTLHLLRLNKVNHCVLVPTDKIHEGMLKKVKDYITWGEVKPDVLARMIVTRGRLTGNVPIDNTFVKKNTEFDTLVKLADAVANEKFRYTDIKGIKPLFRLHPPLQGHEGFKHTYKEGGALGYRGEAINDLIAKMLGPEFKTEKKKAPAKKPVATKATPAVKKTPTKAKPVPKKPAATKAAPAVRKTAPAAKKVAPVKKKETTAAKPAPKKTPALKAASPKKTAPKGAPEAKATPVAKAAATKKTAAKATPTKEVKK